MKRFFRVKHLSRFKSRRFGPLRIRPLNEGGFLGNVSVVHERLPPFSSMPDLYHEKTEEFVLILKGRLLGRLNGRQVRLKPGDVLRLPPKTRHSFMTLGAPAEALSIFFPRMRLDAGNMDVVLARGPDARALRP